MIAELIEQLRAARAEEERAAEADVKAFEALTQTDAYKAHVSTKLDHTTAKLRVEEIEAQIRTAALDEYKASGTKRPHEFVEIKMFSIVKPYNESNAREWCFLNFRPALMLDKKSFEKSAKDGQIPPGIAETDTEPRAQISKKLS